MRVLIFLVGSVAILMLEYFGRRLRTARILLGAGLLVGLSMNAMPWNFAYRLQEAMRPSPTAIASAEVLFDPALGQYHSLMESIPHPQNAAFSEDADTTAVYLPLQLQGIPEHSIVQLDHVTGYVELPGEKRPMLLSRPGNPEEIDVGSTASGTRAWYQKISIRPEVYAQTKDADVTLELDVSATLLHLSSEGDLPVADGSKRFASLGWCESRLNEDQTQTEVRCLDAGYGSQCSTFFLENPLTGEHNPAVHGCRDEYLPWLGRYKPLDAITLTAVDLPFRDVSGLLHYPVNASHLSDSVVRIYSYQTSAHFTRKIVLKNIRLRDWSAER